MASKSKQCAKTHQLELSAAMTLVGHESPFFYYTLDGERREFLSALVISYNPDGQQIISGCDDKITRLWDLQTGKEIKEARVVCEGEVSLVEVSWDGQWIVTADRYGGSVNGWKLKACGEQKGIMKTFKEHSGHINCIDISRDSKLLAGGSWYSTTRIWSLDTGKLVAGPFESDDRVGAVGFSQDSKKLAVNSWAGKCLEVWDIETQELLVTVGKPSNFGYNPNAPMFWTTKDRTIVAAFSFDEDRVPAKTIYEFNASTLDTVRAPFEGHTSYIAGLALSVDCTLLLSASGYDHTIKLWAFESRQLLASFHIQDIITVILSPDARQVAYTVHNSTNIYICNIPPNILANIWPSVCIGFTHLPIC
jgi:WD40 repeat protein